MKEFIVLLILSILLSVVCIAIFVQYANTPVSDIPLWVFWLIK